MKRRKRSIKWVLLFRYEGFRGVYLYEPLRKKQVETRIKNGWEVIK